MTYTVRPISDRSAFTGKHTRSPFEATWWKTRQLLLDEVRRIGGRDLVIELDVTESQIRLDGELYANARTTSPAVRIAFESKYGPLTYATDKFWDWQSNVRAIALSLEALRKVDRYGVTKRGEQYTGWKAIGAGPGTGIAMGGGMTSDEAWAILGSFGDRPIREQRASGDARAQLRKARAFAHPDRHDGDRKLWDQVEQAAHVLRLL